MLYCKFINFKLVKLAIIACQHKNGIRVQCVLFYFCWPKVTVLEAHPKVKNSVKLEEEFNTFLRRILDVGFESINSSLALVIYHFMRWKYGVKEGDEHKHITELSACLKEVFGPDGQRIIEKRLTEEICKELNMSKKQYDLMLRMKFTARIEYAKRKYMHERRLLK
jgi:hypothetical protein